MQTRSVLILGLLVLTLSALSVDARADVVILEGNDVPLTGRILDEDETTIRFRIRGLKESSCIVIQKSRIRRYWREENTYWDHVKAEEERRAAEEPTEAETKPTAEPKRGAPKPAERTAPPSAGSKGEVRIELLDKVVERAERFVPHDPGLRVLAWLAVFGGVSVLFFVGGRIAELSKLGLGKSAILSLVTQFLVLLGVLAHRSAREPATFPLVVAGLVVCWVLTCRMLAGDRFAKSVLLLSFSMAFLIVLAGSVFSVMTVV